MSKATAVEPAAQAVSLHSFVEGSCYDHTDAMRAYRTPVVFRLFTVGRAGALKLGGKLDVTFTSDYGVYYGGTDEYLVDALQQAAPHVDWSGGQLNYHRWLDQSRIQVMCADTGRVLAQIETRRYHGRRVRPEAVERGDYGGNVTTLDMLRAERQRRVMAKLEQEREQ